MESRSSTSNGVGDLWETIFSLDENVQDSPQQAAESRPGTSEVRPLRTFLMNLRNNGRESAGSACPSLGEATPESLKGNQDEAVFHWRRAV